MGTRRSKHNKGRKPFYKEHRMTAADVLAKPAFAPWWNINYDWQDDDEEKLKVLADAGSNIEQSAIALGRSPKAMAWHARAIGLQLPTEWSKLITRKRVYTPREKSVMLAYPYIIKARAEHADLLEINSIIPKSIPDNMRADMCQEIMLAILEGRTTMEILRSRSKSSSYFIRKFYSDNFEQAGHALSFSALEDRSYDEIASSIAAKDWFHEQRAERTRFGDSLKTFTPPDQFEAAWNDQIGRAQIRMHDLGQFLSFEEVEEMLSDPPTTPKATESKTK